MNLNTNFAVNFICNFLYSFIEILMKKASFIAGTMAQLFNAGQEECSVIFLWSYLVAALAVSVWSSVFMWILT